MTAIMLPAGQARAVLEALTEAGVRAPTSFEGDAAQTGPLTLTFTPDLTSAERATFDSIAKLAVGATLLTPAERANVEPDVALLRTYQGIASPTLAQTAAATKAQSRILRAILRD